MPRIFDADGFDQNGFGRDGTHRETGTARNPDGINVMGFGLDGLCNGSLVNPDGFNRYGVHIPSSSYYDPATGTDRIGMLPDGYYPDGFDICGLDRDGYNAKGFNGDGFNREGVHKNGTRFDDAGFDVDGYDNEGFSRIGRDREGYSRNGYNRMGYNREGYDRSGFRINGIHRNGTQFDDEGYDCRGYDREGFSREGYDRCGYDRDGYNEDGYNCDGLDCNGNTRCENGECEDSDCETCNPPDFDEGLDCYSKKAVSEFNWRGDEGVIYAGHEHECYSDNVSLDDVEEAKRKFGNAYREATGHRNRGIICKHDGSLDYKDGGCEFSTVPMTHEQCIKVYEGIKVLGDGEFSAWDCGSEVGHHIHITRKPIGELNVLKIGLFMNTPENHEFVEAIAQRSCRFEAYNTFAEYPAADVQGERKRAKYRNEVLNLGLASTIEFRLFKSNLRAEGILKNTEFCFALVEYCKQASMGIGEKITASNNPHPLHHKSFMKWVAKNHKRFEYLHRFLLKTEATRLVYRRFVAENTIPSNKSTKASLMRFIDRTA